MLTDGNSGSYKNVSKQTETLGGGGASLGWTGRVPSAPPFGRPLDLAHGNGLLTFRRAFWGDCHKEMGIVKG